MIDGTYEATIDTILGSQTGAVSLRSEGAKMLADLDAPVIGRQLIRGQLESENVFNAEGVFGLGFFGMLSYALRGEVEGDRLRIVLASGRGEYVIDGNRVG